MNYLKITMLLTAGLVLNACHEVNIVEVLENWNHQTINAVESCAIEGVKKRGKETLKLISDNKVRSRILKKLTNNGLLKGVKNIYAIESYGGNLTNYSTFLKLDTSSELYQYTYYKKNDSLTFTLLTTESENYGNVIVYFESWDMPTFICDSEFYMTDFYSKMDINN
jgi:hypothetical protein